MNGRLGICLAHPITWVLLGSIACSDKQDGPFDGYVKSVNADRATAPEVLTDTTRRGQRLSLPDSLPQFSLGLPIDVAIAGAPRCEVIIADQMDRAVHRFAIPTGRYKGSIWFPGRGPTVTSSLAGLGAMPEGGVALTHMLAHDLVLLDSSSRVTHSRIITSLSDSLVPGSLVLPLPSGLLAIHWFGTTLPTWSRDWPQRSLPLVQLVDSLGTTVGNIGAVTSVEGTALPAALNRGDMALSGDTLWFARSADATILATAISREVRSLHFTEKSRLPLFYEMRAPVEFFSEVTGEARPQVEYHLVAFTVTPDGRYFIAGQSISWPDPLSGALYRPKTVLSVYDRRSNTSTAYDLKAEIYDLTAGAGALAMIATTDNSRGAGVFLIRAEDIGVQAAGFDSSTCKTALPRSGQE